LNPQLLRKISEEKFSDFFGKNKNPRISFFTGPDIPLPEEKDAAFTTSKADGGYDPDAVVNGFCKLGRCKVAPDEKMFPGSAGSTKDYLQRGSDQTACLGMNSINIQFLYNNILISHIVNLPTS
jgi:hypothetical protein